MLNLQKKQMNQLKNLVYVSIISADSDVFDDEFGLSEDDKQEIMRRYKIDNTNWEYILEPVKDEGKRRILIDLFNEKD